MKVLVLRDCYVGDRYWKKDTVVELPENLYNTPKNFKILEGEAPKIETPVIEQPKVETPVITQQDIPSKVIEETKPEEKEVNPLACTKCGKVCKSDFGLKSHMRSHKEA